MKDSQRAIALSAIRANGLVISARPDYVKSAFTPARKHHKEAPRGVDFLLAMPEDAFSPTIVFRDGLVHLCSDFDYFLCAEKGTLERSELDLLQDCVTLHGRSKSEGNLNFGQRAAFAKLGPLKLHVHPPPPLQAHVFEAMLADVTKAASQLLFDCGGPTSLAMVRRKTGEKEALYPLFRFLRYAMVEAPPDERLDTCFAQIVRTPHNRTFRERVIKSVNSGCDIGPVAIANMACRPEALTVLKDDSPLRDVALSRHFTAQNRAYFPERVMTEQIRTTHDTAENRFIKYLLATLQEILEEISHTFAKQEGFVGSSNYKEALALLNQVRQLRRADFLKEVGQLRIFPASSQVLRKRQGYRELTKLFHLLFLASQLGWQELAQIENRRLDVLYEYWSFFTVLDALRKVYGLNRPVKVKTFVPVASGLLLDLGREGQVSVEFKARPSVVSGCNVTFYRTFEPGQGSYSVKMCPTITIENGRKDILAINVSYGASWRQGRGDKKKWRQEEQVVRLHGLRDALQCKAALVIAPDVESSWFSQSEDKKLSGVGLMAMKPGDQRDLASLTEKLLAFLKS